MLTLNGGDISRAVLSAEVSEQANGGAAALGFTVAKSVGQGIQNGDTAALSVKGETLFQGRVYSRSLSRDTAEISALDGLCGLKAVLPVDRGIETADGFAARLLSLAAPQVKAGAVESCPVALPPRRFEKTPLIEIFYSLIKEVREGAGRFILRDEAGSAAFRNEQSLRLGFALNGKNIVDIDYESSVGDAYSYVKLTSNSVRDAISAVAIAKNEAAIEKWGIRCYVSEVVERNPEQLVLSAKAILSESCRERERITVTAAGDARARAGCLIWSDIGGVGSFWARIISSRHSFEGKSHFMRLELERM